MYIFLIDVNSALLFYWRKGFIKPPSVARAARLDDIVYKGFFIAIDLCSLSSFATLRHFDSIYRFVYVTVALWLCVTVLLCHGAVDLDHGVTVSWCDFDIDSLCHSILISLCHFGAMPLCHSEVQALLALAQRGAAWRSVTQQTSWTVYTINDFITLIYTQHFGVQGGILYIDFDHCPLITSSLWSIFLRYRGARECNIETITKIITNERCSLSAAIAYRLR